MNDAPRIDAERLAERLKAVGLSERKASLQATGQPDTIRFMRTRGTMPSFDRMFAISRVLEASPKYLFGQSDVNDYEAHKETIKNASRFTDSALKQRIAGARQIPVMGSNSLSGPIPEEDGTEQELTLTSISHKVIGFVSAPIGYDANRLRATYVSDPAMVPLFDPDVPVVFDLNEHPRSGDYAMLFIAGTAPSGQKLEGTAFMLRRIIDQTEEWVTVEQLQPLRRSRFEKESIGNALRVLTLRDYLMPPNAVQSPQND